ncbi:cytochrome P450 [Echria macrotheca]|uniref:Cytochrome P450 n=1 Tax=Echria macrotheca TaxID=438768 RepID=A0AAJ0B7T1_9PEZI|nr:cytochrome P450 [Echria macrotheca]
MVSFEAVELPRVSFPVGLALVAGVAIALRLLWRSDPNKPPMLSDVVPYISNTYQYMGNMDRFLARAKEAVKLKNIVGFHLGPKNFFIITGPQNIQALFRTSPHIDFEVFLLIAIESLWRASPEDYAKFKNDKSGRSATPAKGCENQPESKRYWYTLHRVLHKYLETTQYATMLARHYQRFFSEYLEQRPQGEWTEQTIMGLMKYDMAKAAIVASLGTHLFDMHPNLLDMAWPYDEVLVTLLFKPPRWLFRRAARIQDNFHAAISKYFVDANERFDWNGPDADADWEPIFGSRYFRELVKWMKASELSLQTCAGITSTTGIMGLNANSVPVCAWALMELVQDQELLGAVRDEVSTAFTTDPETGKRTLDSQKVLTLPLLQAVYVEVLRMHVSMNITRAATKPLEVEGYTLPAQSILQAPTQISHYNESVWGVEGHPATEFWAYRNIKYVEEKNPETGETKQVPRFEMRGRPTDFFPYGGGIAICPGRHFAKQEIMLSLALIVSKFEIEFLGWEKFDGSPSDRPPKEDSKYAGAAAVPPDRDMRVRWKRIW